MAGIGSRGTFVCILDVCDAIPYVRKSSVSLSAYVPPLFYFNTRATSHSFKSSASSSGQAQSGATWPYGHAVPVLRYLYPIPSAGTRSKAAPRGTINPPRKVSSSAEKAMYIYWVPVFLRTRGGAGLLGDCLSVRREMKSTFEAKQQIEEKPLPLCFSFQNESCSTHKPSVSSFVFQGLVCAIFMDSR
ncbi:hypothetical protein NDU88_009579 [Pleurodeles waltl]|uniref:Uncharacterized protein n=1 Tax=Pleurodeles waltl TaxID=8319 RepID=A0AAV7PZT4_PLEWA|nr:hypothetical protein NDU88_009579 [Pleurodeles waltl]